jgi:hypothetical protein
VRLLPDLQFVEIFHVAPSPGFPSVLCPMIKL